MTKLNYSRPIFRYLDNLRREMRDAPAGAVPDNYGGVPIEIVTGRRNPARAPMPRLTDAEADIAFGMVEALSVYIDADSAVIESFPTMQRKAKRNTAKAIAARNVAEKALVKACMQFLIQCLQSKQIGRDHVMNWYSWLHSAFEKHGDTGKASAWETLHDWAMKSASEQFEQFVEQALHQ